MTDTVTATSAIGTYIIPILGLVIAAITAFGVFYGPRRVARRQEKKEKLKTHFEGLYQKIISQIFQIISGVVDECGTLDASTLRGSRMLATSKMGHFLNRTLLCNQMVFTSSLRPWL